MNACLFCAELLTLFSVVVSGCDPKTGPFGVTRCFLGTPNYVQYQCGTCVSDAYMRRRTEGRLGCLNTTYCYLSCMTEKYGLDRGPVNEDCKCNARTRFPQQRMIPPAVCYNPPGKSCQWYRQCLARTFNCSGPYDYAVTYGEEFCFRYERSKRKLSREARRWLDAARKCLQVALVGVLYLCQERPSCRDIRNWAFDSHVECYVAPTEGLSFCSLPLRDWLNIFWIIKGSFVSSAWWDTVKAAVLTFGKCAGVF